MNPDDAGDAGPVADDPIAAAMVQVADALERQAVALEAVASRTLLPPPAPRRRHTGLVLLLLLVVLICADNWWQDAKKDREKTDTKETR